MSRVSEPFSGRSGVVRKSGPGAGLGPRNCQEIVERVTAVNLTLLACTSLWAPNRSAALSFPP